MPLASTAPPTCEPRIVQKFDCGHIADLGSHLDIVFTSKPARGLCSSLHIMGWRKQESGAYRKCSNPAAIMEAQRIVGEFCQPEPVE